MIETVFQTISNECDAGEFVLIAFQEAVANLANEQGLGVDYWKEYESRIADYNIAWQDSSAGVAICRTFAKNIKNENLLTEVTSLFFLCSNLLAPTIKYLRKIHIVKARRQPG